MWVFFACSEYALSGSTVCNTCSFFAGVHLAVTNRHVLIYSIRNRSVDSFGPGRTEPQLLREVYQNCRHSLWGADFNWVVFVARTTQSMFRMELLKMRLAR